MDEQDIVHALRTGVWNNDQINDIARAVQFARAQLAQDMRRSIRTGITVSFRSRDGSRIQGTVESIKIKNAVISTARGRYRVPCNMLEIA